MTKHVKEPWRIGLCGVDAETNPIESDDGFVFITDAAPDDARRIVACVNACAGIPTDALEAAGTIACEHNDDMQASLLKAWQQRNELLAALEAVKADLLQRAEMDSEDGGAILNISNGVLRKMNDAIDKVKK